MEEDYYTVHRVKSFRHKLTEKLGENSPVLGSSSLAFTPDSQRLILSMWEYCLTVVVQLHHDADSIQVIATIPYIGAEIDGQSRPPVLDSVVSSDGQWFAASDGSMRIFVHSIDSMKVR